MIEKILQKPCPSCGSRLSYSASKQSVSCANCGFQEELDEADDRVKEIELGSTINELETYVAEDRGKKVFHCDNCGSNIMVESTQVAVQCTFCASHKVNLEAFDHRFISPSGVIPFQLDESKGLELFNKWIRKGIFRPNKLKRLATVENLHGIYLPFWTYDVQTESTWSGEAGYRQHGTTGSGPNKNMHNSQQEIRWERRNGHLSYFFDDVLVLASKGLSQKQIQKVFPFNLKKVINYDGKYLLGWEAEIYNLEVDEGYKMAERIVDFEIKGLCEAKLGGDEQRNLRIRTQKSNQTYKHVILPIWICAYRYNNKVYQFLINGQTGKVGGDKPLSWVKIIAAILVFVGLLVVLWSSKQ